MFYVSKTKTLEQKVSYCEDSCSFSIIVTAALNYPEINKFVFIFVQKFDLVLLVQRTLATSRGCFFAKTMTFPLLFNISAKKCNM